MAGLNRARKVIAAFALLVIALCGLEIGVAWGLSHITAGPITGKCEKGDYRISKSDCVWRCAASLEPQGAIWTPMYGCYVFVPAEAPE